MNDKITQVLFRWMALQHTLLNVGGEADAMTKSQTAPVGLSAQTSSHTPNSKQNGKVAKLPVPQWNDAGQSGYESGTKPDHGLHRILDSDALPRAEDADMGLLFQQLSGQTLSQPIAQAVPVHCVLTREELQRELNFDDVDEHHDESGQEQDQSDDTEAGNCVGEADCETDDAQAIQAKDCVMLHQA